MGNRKKKRNNGHHKPKPQSTTKSPATASQVNNSGASQSKPQNPPKPQGDHFAQIIARYKNPSPPGHLWEKHLEIYRMLHSSEASNNHRCKLYRDQVESAILEEATKNFSRIQYTHKRTLGPLYAQFSLPRPAKLIARMDDTLATEMFFMIARMLGLTGVRASMFGGGTVGLTEVFGEQLFIAFLEWLLKNNRPFFEALEDHRPLKEYTDLAANESSLRDDQPILPPDEARAGSLPVSLFKRYQNAQHFTPGTFYETHLEIYRLLQQQNEKRYNHYKVFEMLAIKHLIGFLERLGSRNHSSSRPARLVAKMSDENAARVLVRVHNLLRLAAFKISEVEMFKEQVVIGVLEWLLDNERDKFEDIETDVMSAGLKLKEYL